MTRFRILRIVYILGAVVALLAFGSSVVLGEDKEVKGTKHDLAAPGVSPCTLCHIPGDPEGQGLLAMPANTTGLFAGIRPLCFSCHDGTVTAVGAYVFNPSTPTHLSNPAVREEDCDRCHDPHERGYGAFVKWDQGANMCQNCHANSGGPNHPVDIDAISVGVVPDDRHFDPTTGDFSGTRLWNVDGTEPGDYIKCMTCHAPHGGAPGTALVSVAFVDSGHEAFLPLCSNCHFSSSSEQAEGRE